MELSITEVVKKTKERFVFCDDAATAVALGIDSDRNVILYGPGGHAKSELTLHILKDILKIPEEDIFVKTLSIGTQIEDLLGGISISELTKNDRIIYNVENSFMAKKYVILEEGLDCPPAVLSVLKDILTSKQFRNGNQIYNLQTTCLIILTNKDPKEYATDASISALMERFMIQNLVIWEGYTRKEYLKLYETLYTHPDSSTLTPEEASIDFKSNLEKYELLSELLEEMHKSKSTVSPRSARISSELLARNSWDFNLLKFVRGIDISLIRSKLVEISAKITERTYIKTFQDNLKRYEMLKLLTEIINKDVNVIFNVFSNDIVNILNFKKSLPLDSQSIELNLSLLKLGRTNFTDNDTLVLTSLKLFEGLTNDLGTFTARYDPVAIKLTEELGNLKNQTRAVLLPFLEIIQSFYMKEAISTL